MELLDGQLSDGLQIIIIQFPPSSVPSGVFTHDCIKRARELFFFSEGKPFVFTRKMFLEDILEVNTQMTQDGRECNTRLTTVGLAFCDSLFFIHTYKYLFLPHLAIVGATSHAVRWGFAALVHGG